MGYCWRRLHHSPSLKLEYLTSSGITVYVSTQIYENPGFNELRKRQTEYATDLVKQIVTKSSGVFLWVSLVAQNPLLSLTNGDRLSDLQETLDPLPTSLEDLFRKFLDNLNPNTSNTLLDSFRLCKRAGADTIMPFISRRRRWRLCHWERNKAIDRLRVIV